MNLKTMISILNALADQYDESVATLKIRYVDSDTAICITAPISGVEINEKGLFLTGEE